MKIGYNVTTDRLRRVSAAKPDEVGSFLCVQYAGSIAHGTVVPKDDPHATEDVDVLGVFLPTPEAVYGLRVCDHWTEWDEEIDITMYEVRKYARLLMKGNPNVLSMLWSEHANLYSQPLWGEWIKEREIFLSQRVLSCLLGYAAGQLNRLRKPNVEGYMGARRKALFHQYGYDVKNAAHCIRLLHMAEELLDTGTLNVDRTGIDAEQLKEIKTGQWTMTQVEKETDLLFRQVEQRKSALPPLPDAERVEKLVMATLQAGLAPMAPK